MLPTPLTLHMLLMLLLGFGLALRCAERLAFPAALRIFSRLCLLSPRGGPFYDKMTAYTEISYDT